MWINWFTGHRSTSNHLRYINLFFFWIYVITHLIWDMFIYKSEQLKIMTPCLKWVLSYKLCNLKKLSLGDASNYTFLEFLWQSKHFDTIFREIEAYFNFWPMHNPPRSMAAIFEMPQHVVYLKKKILPMALLNSVKTLTVLTFCTQCLCLAVLLHFAPALRVFNICSLQSTRGWTRFDNSEFKWRA